MKSLVFVCAAFLAVSFSACGNKAGNTEAATKADSTVVTETTACKAACTSNDSTACQAACDSTKACKTACDSTHACKSACDSTKAHACKSHCGK